MTSQRTRDRMVARLREQGIRDELVLAAMASVPRHLFVEEALASRAYEDSALPIGFEQTISQPYVVARMVEAARSAREWNCVLEVGTGCGYQAAVIAKLAKRVYSIERIAAMLDKARANLRPQRISNLRLAHGDGYLGMPDMAPFDAIIVSAAAPQMPAALLDQLAVGGRLVAPIGTQEQVMIVVERTESGFKETRLDAVRFVPMRLGKV